MIYASLKSIARWSNAWVPPAYLLLGLATGALLLMLLTHLFGLAAGIPTLVAALLVLFAAAAKIAYWNSVRRAAAVSNVSTATGLGKAGLVRLLDAPHTESNYLLQEMGYRVARKHAVRLRIIAVAALFAVPFALLLAIVGLPAGPLATPFTVLAVTSAAIGVLVERWLFFAEAKHVVTLYYGADST
jgi:DMSO reductase anchor subunit